MNIFLPYETNFRASVRALDDKRLNKQLLECYQLINNVIKERKGEKVVGYKNHPIYLHYKQYFQALILYAWNCCMEYLDRFEKFHALHNQINWLYLTEVDTSIAIPFTPFYMQGSKGQPNYIRTTEKVSELYQNRLIEKWENDKANGRQPKWTNQEPPIFYKYYLNKKQRGKS